MLNDILNKMFFQNSLLDYIISFAILLIGIIIIKLLKIFLLRPIKKLAKQTATAIDDFLITILKKTLIPLLYYGVFFISLQSLTLHPIISKSIEVIGVILLTVFGVIFLTSFVEYLIKDYLIRDKEEREKRFKGILPAIKIVIWLAATVFLLDNFGFKISTVIAGLGIGGIAIAIASQAVLGELFSYFSILFDRPFEIGDFIIIGDYMGAVEKIGIKTTRIRSLSGEQLIFSNTDLTNSRVRNYKRMDRRRVVFKLGVTYETSLSNLKEIPLIIKDIITNIEDTVFDRAHFSSYGDFNLEVEVVYYVIGSDYNKYMDIQQEINLAIFDEFEKRSIDFAYPTQTLHIQRENPDLRIK